MNEHGIYSVASDARGIMKTILSYLQLPQSANLRFLSIMSLHWFSKKEKKKDILASRSWGLAGIPGDSDQLVTVFDSEAVT